MPCKIEPVPPAVRKLQMREIGFFLSVSMLCLSACSTMPTPKNAGHTFYAAQQQAYGDTSGAPKCHAAATPSELASLKMVDAAQFTFAPDQLSIGDRLRLTVSGDKDRLTGTYVIAADGSMLLADSIAVTAAGKTVRMLEHEIAQILVEHRQIRAVSGGVSLQPVELAGALISVSGAVFEPGVVRVGERQPEVRSLNLSSTVAGDQNISRTLSTALRAAGGVRPDADPRSIYVVRGDQYARIDMSAAIDGGAYADVPLSGGDRVVVASVGCLQDKLVRPSPITAPGIHVYLSNLSRPAQHNAGSAIGRETSSLPYGTRFLQGLVSANCVGGSAMNAGRSAVLISRNPVTGQSIVLSRSVEQLVRDADRDQFDPYLMPGDAIACYDSLAMNLRDVLSVVGETTTPYLLLGGNK